MKDNINPDHYKNSTSLECIESMIIIFGYQKTLDFCLLNAWKYIWRWKNKNGIEDLNKASWYTNKALELNPELKEKEMLKRMETYIAFKMRENK